MTVIFVFFLFQLETGQRVTFNELQRIIKLSCNYYLQNIYLRYRKKSSSFSNHTRSTITCLQLSLYCKRLSIMPVKIPKGIRYCQICSINIGQLVYIGDISHEYSETWIASNHTHNIWCLYAFIIFFNIMEPPVQSLKYSSYL